MRILIFVFCLLLSNVTFSQSWKDRVKDKVNNRIDSKIDRAIDKTLDNAEKTAEDAVKSEKKNEEESRQNMPKDQSANGELSQVEKAPITLKTYSKFDFISGQKIIAIEDFSQDAIGDFPDKWNTNASAELVSIEGNKSKWLQLNSACIVYPEYFNELPENFTLEFDVAASTNYDNSCYGLSSVFVENQKNLLNPTMQNSVDVNFLPSNNSWTNFFTLDENGNEKVRNDKAQSQWQAPNKVFAKVSIWRQKNRLRVYLNEEKLWDIPKAFAADGKYRFLLKNGFCYENNFIYVSNFKLAVGAPDTRNKLITEGKFTTTGIQFDSGKDNIKPESYGVLKEIANILQENPSLKIRITGHTDADGDAKVNQKLSEARALAVKNMLTNEFKIAPDRMQTAGKGASIPLSDNATTIGKANNRRVDFEKI